MVYVLLCVAQVDCAGGVGVGADEVDGLCGVVRDAVVGDVERSKLASASPPCELYELSEMGERTPLSDIPAFFAAYIYGCGGVCRSCGSLCVLGCEERCTSSIETLLSGSRAPRLRGARRVQSQWGTVHNLASSMTVPQNLPIQRIYRIIFANTADIHHGLQLFARLWQVSLSLRQSLLRRACGAC